MNTIIDPIAVREEVRNTYGKIARGEQASCCPANPLGCCSVGHSSAFSAAALGYNAGEIAALPVGLSLGCGNPQAIASLKPGETVLDLGSGAGFDCFLAARAVAPTGRVIGVDMTAEMLSKARASAAKAGIDNLEFKLGEIESLPMADNAVDVVISNCVINLSPDRPQVFREALRVLKPGGRLAIADIVRTAPMPGELSTDLAAHCGCVAGAASVDEIETMLREAGFEKIQVRIQEPSREFIRDWMPGKKAEQYVVSATIEAVKPTATCCGPACCH